MRVEISHVKGQFLGTVRPTEKHWGLCCSVRSKMDNSMLNNRTTRDAVQIRQLEAESVVSSA